MTSGAYTTSCRGGSRTAPTGSARRGIEPDQRPELLDALLDPGPRLVRRKFFDGIVVLERPVPADHVADDLEVADRADGRDHRNVRNRDACNGKFIRHKKSRFLAALGMTIC